MTERDPKLRLLLGEIPPEEDGLIEIAPGLFGTVAFREALLRHPRMRACAEDMMKHELHRIIAMCGDVIPQEIADASVEILGATRMPDGTVHIRGYGSVSVSVRPKPAPVKRTQPRAPVGRKQWWVK